jgi:hypothetical protein
MAQSTEAELRSGIRREYGFETGHNVGHGAETTTIRLSPAVRQFLNEQGQVRVYDIILNTIYKRTETPARTQMRSHIHHPSNLWKWTTPTL